VQARRGSKIAITETGREHRQNRRRTQSPYEINAIIEVPLRSDPVKYEFDESAGAIVVDRFLYTTMFYPCNYGFIPHTLAEDGDAVDVMVLGRIPVLPGAVLPVRPVGVLRMRDEAGPDDKILAVPLSGITRLWERVQTYRDCAEIELERIAHFFQHYKGPRALQVDRTQGAGASRRKRIG
jgi:inorganic pyrophosphatase